MDMKLRKKIINQAMKINFGERFGILRDAYPYPRSDNECSEMSNISIDKVTGLIESHGYAAKRNKNEVFLRFLSLATN